MNFGPFSTKERGFISFLSEGNFTTTTRAETNYRYMEMSPVGRVLNRKGGFLCLGCICADHIHTLIQRKIHKHCESCLCCAAWWHSFIQRKAEQTPQPSQKPDTIRDGNLNPCGPRREISSLFRLHAKEG